MRTTRSPLRFAACALAAGIVALGWTAGSTCRAQAVPPVPGTATTPPGTANPSMGQGETSLVTGGYDYFTANLDPGLANYLELVTRRHAGAHTWGIFWDGKYAEAQGDCQYSLERFPNHPTALHLVGEIAKATHDPSLAIPYYENALRLYPQYAFTHSQYGSYLIDIGATVAGIEQFREALRLDPTQFQAKAWLAQALAAHPELANVGAAGDSTGTRAGDQPPATPGTR
jgi:tetratricopeptide (TPR) repeat protein